VACLTADEEGMNGLRNRLQTWISLPFQGEGSARRQCAAALPAEPGPEYVLRGWPELPEDLRCARVYRLLSILSVGPSGRGRLLARTAVAPHDFDRLLGRLLDEKIVEVRQVRLRAAEP
jgi:hypothetical protein